jgi:hypothetical protein
MGTQHRDYSGTPLWRKLGIAEGARVLLVAAPAGFDRSLVQLAPLPADVTFLRRRGRALDVVLLFVTRRADLEARFPPLATSVAASGRLWVAWPTKASGIPTDLDFDAVQGVGLSAGLVGTKSASIAEGIQGLMFVIRVRDRST